DYVDILYLHGVAPTAYPSVRDEYLAEMQRARDAGLIRFLGVSERYQTDHAHQALQDIIREGHFDVVMVGLNLLSPAAVRSVLPLALEQDIGVVVMCAVRTVLVKPDLVRGVIEAWTRDGLLEPGRVPGDAPLDWLLDANAQTVADAA